MSSQSPTTSASVQRHTGMASLLAAAAAASNPSSQQETPPTTVDNVNTTNLQLIPLPSNRTGTTTGTAPTYIGHIATTQDCLLLFEACRVGLLKRITRRLTEQEREACIVSGSVFVWEEDESGIKRWTDSKSWSPSRIKGSFLVYREVDEATARRRASSSTSPSPPSSPHQYSSRRGSLTKPLLTKKSISVKTKEGGKLHLVAYYTKTDVTSGRLQTPREDPGLRGVAVRAGLYPDVLPEVSLNLPPSSSSSSNVPTGEMVIPNEVVTGPILGRPGTGLYGSYATTSPTGVQLQHSYQRRRTVPTGYIESSSGMYRGRERTPESVYGISAAKRGDWPYDSSSSSSSTAGYYGAMVPFGSRRGSLVDSDLSLQVPVGETLPAGRDRHERDRDRSYRPDTYHNLKSYRSHPYAHSSHGYYTPRHASAYPYPPYSYNYGHYGYPPLDSEKYVHGPGVRGEAKREVSDDVGGGREVTRLPPLRVVEEGWEGREG